MNDQEAFDEWWMEGFKGMSEKMVIKYRDVGKQSYFNGWQAACEYKQKELEKKLELAVEALERLDKITALAESAKYIIKESLAAIKGDGA